MGEHVVDEGVEHGREFGGHNGDEQRLAGHVDRQPAVLVLCQHAPKGHPLPADLGEVRHDADSATYGLGGVANDLIDRLRELVDAQLHPPKPAAVGHRGNLGPQGGDGGAKPMGEVGDSGALGAKQLVDPVRQLIQRDADCLHFARPGRHHASPHVTTAQPPRRVCKTIDASYDRPTDPI